MEASSKVGIVVRGSVREGNAPIPAQNTHVLITSFAELFNNVLTYQK